ncbi:MAG: hypothetical protein JO352_09390 [Chloroflexi bacterium]|nr:hypothetical protein [Chloroflexota bacterium]MBV9601460.1 hypothetical protein [Chloroflexota bacterium]
MPPLIGIQVPVVSLVDEGFPQTVDRLNELGVNAMFVATQAFDRGVQGRRAEFRPWPGHGPREIDDHRGGAYFTQHAEYYRGTLLGPWRAPDTDVRGVDVLEQLLPVAQARNTRVYSFILENTHSGLTRLVPNWSKVLQVDAMGRTDNYACIRNPDYINWMLSLVEDQIKSYPIDGLMFGSERNGPLGNVLEDGGLARDGRPYCFCEYCVAAGERESIDSQRAAEGYRKLYSLATGHDDPVEAGDSAYVRFWRLLLKYPEIIAWEQFWHRGYESLLKRIYGTAKFLNKDLQVGWHIWHHNSFSAVYRAQMSFAEIAEYSDFVKPVIYNSVAGYRIHAYIRALCKSIYRGIDAQTVYDLHRQALGYDEACKFDDLPGRGFSPDYVRRESARTVGAVAGKARVYPGIDVDVAAPDHVIRTTPESIGESLSAAFQAGVDGVVISRKYSEMEVKNLESIGRTLRALGHA